MHDLLQMMVKILFVIFLLLLTIFRRHIQDAHHNQTYQQAKYHVVCDIAESSTNFRVHV